MSFIVDLVKGYEQSSALRHQASQLEADKILTQEQGKENLYFAHGAERRFTAATEGRMSGSGLTLSGTPAAVIAGQAAVFAQKNMLMSQKTALRAYGIGREASDKVHQAHEAIVNAWISGAIDLGNEVVSMGKVNKSTYESPPAGTSSSGGASGGTVSYSSSDAASLPSLNA